jgi:hypothetical protein
MPTIAKSTSKVESIQAIVVNVGGRPPVYQKQIVRDRHTGLLEEIELSAIEAPPIDEGDPGVAYAFKANEKVPADHPAVQACPGAFRPVED